MFVLNRMHEFNLSKRMQKKYFKIMKIAKFSFLKKQNLEKVKTLFDAKFHSEQESVIVFFVA